MRFLRALGSPLLVTTTSSQLACGKTISALSTFCGIWQRLPTVGVTLCVCTVTVASVVGVAHHHRAAVAKARVEVTGAWPLKRALRGKLMASRAAWASGVKAYETGKTLRCRVFPGENVAVFLPGLHLPRLRRSRER